MHGYVVKPANYVPGKKYPVAFLIHGGPQGSFGNGWSYRWNPQTYAGQGFAVVMVDFHGSAGYGQAFTDAISQHWGDRPLEDLQKGWAAALAKYDFLDGDRACALGASYGGYMVNWIAGNWPQPWKCLVTHDGVFDSADDGLLDRGTVVHRVGERRHAVGRGRRLSRSSTRSTTSTKWKAPMLVIHGAQDFRIPYDAGHRRVHRRAAPGHREPAAVLPGREPLGAQAAEQRALARHRQRLAEALDASRLEPAGALEQQVQAAADRDRGGEHDPVAVAAGSSGMCSKFMPYQLAIRVGAASSAAQPARRLTTSPWRDGDQRQVHRHRRGQHLAQGVDGLVDAHDVVVARRGSTAGISSSTSAGASASAGRGCPAAATPPAAGGSARA